MDRWHDVESPEDSPGPEPADLDPMWSSNQRSATVDVSPNYSPRPYLGTRLAAWRSLYPRPGVYGGVKLSDWRAEPRPTRDKPPSLTPAKKQTEQPPGPKRTVVSESPKQSPLPLKLQIPSSSLQWEGLDAPVHHYRETHGGWGIGFTEDGRVLIAQPPAEQGATGDIHEDEEDDSWKFQRQNSELFQVAPRAKEDGSHIQQLEEIFDRVDENRDGCINKAELRQALEWSAESNKVKLRPELIEELVNLIFEEADGEGEGEGNGNGNGTIELQELVTMIYGRDAYTPRSGKLERSSTFLQRALFGAGGGADPIDDMPLRPRSSDWMKGLLLSRRFRQEARFYLLNNWQAVGVLVLWLCLNAFVFTRRFLLMEDKPEHRVLGSALSFAKGGAELVKLNMALLLFPVCRWTISSLRGTFLRYIIPFDEALEFHKLTAVMTVIGSVIHTVAVMGGTYVRVSTAPRSEFEAVLGPAFANDQPTYGELLKSQDAVTGWVLWAILLVFFLMSHNNIRQSLAKHSITAPLGSFGAFWWSHLVLFPCFFVLTFYHGSKLGFEHFPTTDTWKYLVGPVALYLLEKVNKVFATRLGQRWLDVIQVETLPGNVLSLHLSNPPFKFQSGMYVFIRCPAVSTFEWHPFSITSAPSDFELTVHIRALGDWTNAMLDFWKQERRKGESLGAVNSSGEIVLEAFHNTEKEKREPSPLFRYPRVYLDGPHGSPTQDYESFRVIMLVGAGIGVTPMASVVRDVLHKSKHRRKYPRFSVEKVHFFWTTREQESFEWFSGLMAQAAAEDSEGVVDMHNYLTSAYGDDDPRSFLLKAAQDRYHARTGHDIIANTTTKIATHFSRPDWDTIIAKIVMRTPNTVIGVFFCGPRALEKELRATCCRHTMQATNGTSLVFRKENF